MLSPDVSVVITAYNQNDDLALNVPKWTAQGVNLIVVDDGSAESPEELVRDNGGVYLWQPDEGFRQPSAFQRGLDAASGFWVFFSDAAAIPTPEFIETHVDAWRPRYMNLGSRRYREGSLWRGDDRNWSKFTESDFWYTCGSNMFCETEALRSVGGWCTDYDFKYGLADTDVGLRWVYSGRSFLYVPDAMITFNESRTCQQIDDAAKKLFERRLCDLALSCSTSSTRQSAIRELLCQHALSQDAAGM
jgi:glycosyltransferase involved in cell wall biosynthesis